MRRGELSRCCVTLRIALRGFWRHLSYCLLALTRPLERSAVKRRAGQIASPMTGPRPRPVGQRSDLLLTPWEPALDGKISFVARYSQVHILVSGTTITHPVTATFAPILVQ